MAYNQNYGGIDYSQYGNWQQTKGPNGENWYIVPGGAGYVYDPYLSNLTQRVQLHHDPTAALKARQDQIDQQKAAASPLNQIAPVAGSVLGIYGANKLINLGASAPTPPVPTPSLSTASQTFANQATINPVAATNPGLSDVASSNIGQGLNPGTGSSGYTLGAQDGTSVATDASDWTTAEPGTAGQIFGAVATAKGAYDVAQGFQHGGAGTRQGLTEVGSGLGSFASPLGSVAGAAYGNALGYGLQGNGWKNDAVLIAAGPPGWALLGAKKLGLTQHETTRQYAQKNTERFIKDAGDDKNALAYVQGIRQQYNAPPPDPKHPFAGKYATWDEYKKAGLIASNLTGVAGNIDTFGAKTWGNLSEDQRTKVTQALIDANQYNSHKGEVVIADPSKAKEIFQKVIGGTPANTTPPVTTAPVTTAPVTTNPVTNPPGTTAGPAAVTAPAKVNSNSLQSFFKGLVHG